MSFSFSISQSVLNESRSISKENSFEAAAKASTSEVVAPEADDELIDIAFPVSGVKCLYVVASHDMTIKTNDDGSPDDTIELVGGVPYLYHENSYDSLLFTQDVDQIYVTHGEPTAGEDATLEIEVLWDPTS